MFARPGPITRGGLLALAFVLAGPVGWAGPPAARPSAAGRPSDSEHLADILSGRAARRVVAERRPDATPPETEQTAARLDDYLPRGRRQARSVGKPNRGRLEDGVELPREGPGYKRLDRDRHFGTDETIALIRYAGARLLEAYPGTEPMLVGDISQEGGGRVRPHRSHQSGRDADIAFFERGNPHRRHYNGDVTAAELDLDKSWFLLETLLVTGRVEYVFINRSLHDVFRAHAASVGWNEEALDRIFESPDNKRALIRHAAGHTYHFHVRFTCGDDDRRCKSY